MGGGGGPVGAGVDGYGGGGGSGYVSGNYTLTAVGTGTMAAMRTDPNYAMTLTAGSIATTKKVFLTTGATLAVGLVVSIGTSNNTIASITSGTLFTLKNTPTASGTTSVTISGFGAGGLGSVTNGGNGVPGKVWICY
jgi:hypothetical protein